MSAPRHFFTPAEDQMILKWREKRPDAPWAEIAKKLKGKTAKQCNDRYNKHLKIARNDEPWSVSEDKLLTQLVEEHGHNWVIVSRLLGTRSNIETKNRWSVLLRMKNSKKKSARKNKPKKHTESAPNPPTTEETPIPKATTEEFILLDPIFTNEHELFPNLDYMMPNETAGIDDTFSWFEL